MEEKQCSICKETKSTSEFRRDKTRKDGFHPYCKVCQLQYRRKDPDNLVRIEGERRRHQRYYHESIGKETGLAAQRTPKGKARAKAYSQTEQGRLSQKNTRINRVLNGKSKAHVKDKYDNDVCFKIRHNLSGRVRQALRLYSNNKDCSIKELVGCSIEELKLQFESQFTEDMNWSNYGMFGWHIDHIVPCSDFNLEKEEEQKICFHHLNLQPLWRNENCYTKGAKVPENKEEIINKIKAKLQCS